MGLGFGLLSAQLRPGETDWTRAYEDTVRLAVEAERLGFASVWTTEHHFVDDGYMPSLLVVSAALAQATARIEIGTGVILAPMHHPLRLAEDAATVQLLSHGRLVLGLGLGWVLDELEQAGRDPSTFRFIHYSILLPGASRADALARYRDAVWGLNWKYSDMEASATRPLPAASPPPFEGDDERLLSRRTAYAGTPDELVEALLQVRKQVSVPIEFVARSHLPVIEYEAQVELMQQLAEGVAPHV